MDYFFETTRTKDASKQIEELEVLNDSLGEKQRALMTADMRRGLGITFRTEDAKKRYFNSKQKKETERINQQVKSFMIDLPNYIIERYKEGELHHRETVGKIKGLSIRQSKTELLPQAKNVDFSRFIEAVKQFLINVPEEKRKNICERILYKSLDIFYGGFTLGINPTLEDEMEQATEIMKDTLMGIILNGEQINMQTLQIMEANAIATHENAAESVTYRTRVKVDYLEQAERILQEESDVLRVMEMENLPIEEKKKRIDEIVERHNMTMDDLAKAALRGERAATRRTIRNLINENDKSRGVWC